MQGFGHCNKIHPAVVEVDRASTGTVLLDTPRQSLRMFIIFWLLARPKVAKQAHVQVVLKVATDAASLWRLGQHPT